MRLIESVPDVAEKIEEGSINLSTASQVQNFIKSERKNGGSVSYKQRVEMINAIENKSARDVEKHLINLKPENVIRPEKIRMVTPEIIEMRLMIPDDLKEKMDKLRQIFSHRIPDMTYLALMEYLVNQALKKVEKKHKSSSPALRLKAPEGHLLSKRNIPSTLRHAVWLRDGGVCSYQDPQTGRKCGGRNFVQVDHIHPWSKGGENKLENLQLLCAEHNRHKNNRTPS
ncbi:HNH endonuclease [Bdellovibrio bacteriovorus]|nr:HNH endonuclease signature motif containing protein [Bdellovibrio bacteriovorus]